MYALTYVALAVSLIAGLLALFRGGVILFKYRSGYRTLALVTLLRGFHCSTCFSLVLAVLGAWTILITEAKFGKELKGSLNSAT